MTQVVVVVVVAAAVVYDVAAFWFAGKDATITHVVRGWGAKFPFVAFAIGLLAGHLLP